MLSMDVRLQGLKGPMPIYPERSDRPSEQSLRPVQAIGTGMRYAQPLRAADLRVCPRPNRHFGLVDVECWLLGTAAWIRMVFVSEWCVNFMGSHPASAPQSVDRTPLRNGLSQAVNERFGS